MTISARLYREFVASLQGNVNVELELDLRDQTAAVYVRLSREEVLESEVQDLVAIFSRGMAVTRPLNMKEFAEIIIESLQFFVRTGHPAEALLQKLREARSRKVIIQIHELLTLASKDEDVRDLILDGEILKMNNPKKKSMRR